MKCIKTVSELAAEMLHSRVTETDAALAWHQNKLRENSSQIVRKEDKGKTSENVGEKKGQDTSFQYIFKEFSVGMHGLWEIFFLSGRPNTQ